MALKRPNGPGGRVVTLEHTSKLLAGNPLGDPHVRGLHVWLPPQYDRQSSRGRGRRFPVLFDLVGYTGSGFSHTNWRSFDENVQIVRSSFDGELLTAEDLLCIRLD